MPRPRGSQGCGPSETWRGLISPCSDEAGAGAGSAPLLPVALLVPEDEGIHSGRSPPALVTAT